MRQKRHMGLVAAICGAVVLATACSSTSSTSSTSTQGSAAAESTASGGQTSQSNTALAERVKADTAIPPWTAPGPPVNVTALKGKKVFIIPIIENPFNQDIEAAYRAIFGAAGIKYTIYSNQGQTSQWVAGMNEAISEHVNLIILDTAPDPRVLQPQIREAKAAGIPVEVTHFYDVSDPAPPKCLACAAGVTAIVPAPLTTSATGEADWIINDSGGHAHVLIVASPDVISNTKILAAMEKEYSTYCPECTYKIIGIPVAQWSTQVASSVESALNGDPSINYIDAEFDAMCTGVTQAVTSTGRVGKVKVVSFNGSPFALDDIRTGNIITMDASENTWWIGYADADQAFRLLSGMSPVNETTPYRLIDKSNVEQVGVPATTYLGYGTAYANGFWKLWGLPGSPSLTSN